MATKFINPALPQDVDHQVIQLTPAITAKSSYYSNVLSTASEYLLTMNNSANILRVIALDNGVTLKWATGVANTGGSFDEYIPANSAMDFVIPETKTTASFLADGGTARLRIIEK